MRREPAGEAPRTLMHRTGLRPDPEARIWVTWLETEVPPAIQPASPDGPGWAPYLLGALSGVLLLLCTVGWPWWRQVGLALEAWSTGTAPRP